MRSHSSLPIFARHLSHRAPPNCALSLATASAFSRAVKSRDDTEAMDVDFEPPVAVVAEGVPFPSDSGKSPRKHALLRSSAPLGTSILSASPTTEHQPPPRKRTRTSALLQPPVKSQRSPRLQSLPVRTSPSRLPRPVSPSLFPPRTKQVVQAKDPFTYAFPTSSMPTVMPQSALFNLISCLIIPASLDCPSVEPSIPSRRRNTFSGGTILLRNIYKSVVYGLALKYSATDSLQSAQVYQGASRNMARSPFDIQDALLADRLRCHLTLHGEDLNIVAFEIEKMGRHPTEGSSLPHSSQGVPIPILSYERLVSFILLQRSLEGRNKTSRKGSDRLPRMPSKLTESYTIG